MRKGGKPRAGVRPIGVGMLFTSLLLSIPVPPTGAQAAGETARPQGEAEIDAALAEARIGNLRPSEMLLGRADLGPATHLLKAQYSAALLREADMKASLAAYFSAGDDHPARMSRARSIAASSAFAAGDYREAAAQASALLSTAPVIPDDERKGFERLAAIASLLADASPQKVVTIGNGAPTPITRDKVGLIRIAMDAGAHTQEAVIDTGANLSVASASAASKMGLRIIEGHARVGNSVGTDVGVRLGIADRLEFAGAQLRNVVFLVMEDEALTFPVPGGYRIDAIIGLPVLRAIGRFRFTRNDFRIEPAAQQAAQPQNLRLIGSDPYVVVTIAGHDHPLFLDSGANLSSLFYRYGAEHPEWQVGDAAKGSRGGAGGVQQVESVSLKNLPLRLGALEKTVPAIGLSKTSDEGKERAYGVFGADLITVFDNVLIDFTAMRMDAQ